MQDTDVFASELRVASCTSCRRDLDELRAALALLENERHLLTQEVTFLRKRVALLREALNKARDIIIRLKDEEPRAPANQLAEKPSRRLLPILFQRLKGPKSDRVTPVKAIYRLPRRSEAPRYIGRSELEGIISQTAQLKACGLHGVVIDFERNPGSTSAPNWKVCGIISGKADRNAAVEAVRRAAEQYACWVMVEDHSHLNGKALRRKSPKPASGSAA